MRVVVLGLAITSSWGNGHATTYRALVRGLATRGHDVLFLERDQHWYRDNRDLPQPPYCRVELYEDVGELAERFGDDLRDADLVILGSYVPEGIEIADVLFRVARGCTAFYDIDTPVTLAALERGSTDYLHRRHVPRFDLYLSFTGGPTLDRLERDLGARCARPLYCSVDPETYYPEPDAPKDFDLGYLGTYSADRQPTLDRFLIQPAARWHGGRFVIAGPQYPDDMAHPPNVERITHLSPREHRTFYNRVRFTLNVTRQDMIAAGFSPSVRLFEAAACGTPIVSDEWKGLETVLTPGTEILLARTGQDVLGYLRDMPDCERLEVGRSARRRVLRAHTSVHRAIELEQYVAEAGMTLPAPLPAPPARIA